MSPLRNIADLVAAYDAGRFHAATIRKVLATSIAGNWWADLSMMPGYPVPNYYASNPLSAALLDGFRGVFVGDSRSPAETYLNKLQLTVTAAAMTGQYMLLDYLLYYPFIDGDTLDEQVLDNTVTLPRYTDGEGVMMMPVVVAPTGGGGQGLVNFFDSQGVERQVSFTCATIAAPIGSVVTSHPRIVGTYFGPFLYLGSDVTGVRSVKSVQFTTPSGGLFAMVLVKPLIQISVLEANTPTEIELPQRRLVLPRVYDGAYLNFVAQSTGTLSGSLCGEAGFIWST